MEELERDMAAEVENIRSDARDREETLRRQLEESRTRLGEEAERRETLLDQIQNLQSRLANPAEDESYLQLQVQYQSFSQSQQISGSTALPLDDSLFFADRRSMDIEHRSVSRDRGQKRGRQNRYPTNLINLDREDSSGDERKEDEQGESEWDVDDVSEEIERGYGDRHEDDGVRDTADLSAFFLIGDNGTGEDIEVENGMHRADTTVVSTVDDAIGIRHNSMNRKESSNHHASVVSPAGSLHGREIVLGDGGEREGDGERRIHDKMLSEISRLTEREAFLQRGLEQQTSKLALVLRRAAQMMPADVQRNKERGVEENRDNVRERKRFADVIGEKENQLLSLQCQMDVLRQQVVVR